MTRLRPATVASVVLLVAAPAVIVPGALNRFVFGKLAFAALGAAAAAGSTPAGRLRREARWLAGAGAVTLLASALAGTAPVVSLLGRAPRYEGAAVIATYAAVASAGARLLGPRRDARRDMLTMRALACLSLVVAAIAVVEAVGLRPLSSDVARPGGLLGNASDEGAVGILCLGPLALAAARSRDAVVAAGALAAALTAVLSASRGALAAGLVTIALVGVTRGGRRVYVGTAAIVAAFVGLAMALPATRNRVLGSSPLAGHTVSGRWLLWGETLRLDAAHLVFGVGPSIF